MQLPFQPGLKPTPRFTPGSPNDADTFHRRRALDALLGGINDTSGGPDPRLSPDTIGKAAQRLGGDGNSLVHFMRDLAHIGEALGQSRPAAPSGPAIDEIDKAVKRLFGHAAQADGQTHDAVAGIARHLIDQGRALGHYGDDGHQQLLQQARSHADQSHASLIYRTLPPDGGAEALHREWQAAGLDQRISPDLARRLAAQAEARAATNPMRLAAEARAAQQATWTKQRTTALDLALGLANGSNGPEDIAAAYADGTLAESDRAHLMAQYTDRHTRAQQAWDQVQRVDGALNGTAPPLDLSRPEDVQAALSHARHLAPLLKGREALVGDLLRQLVNIPSAENVTSDDLIRLLPAPATPRFAEEGNPPVTLLAQTNSPAPTAGPATPTPTLSPAPESGLHLPKELAAGLPMLARLAPGAALPTLARLAPALALEGGLGTTAGLLGALAAPEVAAALGVGLTAYQLMQHFGQNRQSMLDDTKGKAAPDDATGSITTTPALPPQLPNTEGLIPPILAPDHKAASPEPPPELPNKTENIPEKPDARDLVEVLPNQYDELGKACIVEDRRGSPETQQFNTEIRKAVQGLLQKRDDHPGTHIGGGYKDARPDNPNATPEPKRETYIGPKVEGPTIKGGSFLDITVESKDGRTIHINTVDTLADGRTLSLREDQAARRIAGNKSPSDLFITIAKPKLGQAYDMDKMTTVLDRVINGRLDLKNPADIQRLTADLHGLSSAP